MTEDPSVQDISECASPTGDVLRVERVLMRVAAHPEQDSAQLRPLPLEALAAAAAAAARRRTKSRAALPQRPS
eukprot:CAMPEP_0115458118 /NCGR_PEP_ID=MMETSP0271-20121206/45566_1 /TAXON_ID=71861 /ORGANISM="Scrippsiella trochoidea, Strain CCMP3099" /LENGTH=72 /DNA_ID=CAMNT_0002884709 /DNA_START=33 /DNA_END=249 /DNA_ORIENTATION=+